MNHTWKLVQNMYDGPTATLMTDAENDEFQIGTGTKQGDPLSSLPFNAVLQHAMEKDTETWKKKGL